MQSRVFADHRSPQLPIEFELYVEATSDFAPIFYLIDKFLGDRAAVQAQAVSDVKALLEQLPGMLDAAGINKTRGRK